MDIASRIAAWEKSGGRVPTAADYVQNGLVAMWDGIENTGWGTHSGSPSSWKDLVGQRDFSLLDATYAVYADSIEIESGEAVAEYGQTAGSIETVEMVVSLQHVPVAKPPVEFLTWPSHSDYYQRGFGLGQDVLSLSAGSSGSSKVTFEYAPVANKPFAISSLWNYRSVIASSIYVNNVVREKGVGYHYIVQDIDVIKLWNKNRMTIPRVYSLRFYSRTLTASEIAANYAIDRIRFNLS